MKQDQICNFFIIILEGHCSVSVGQDGMMFDNGPFSYFGHKALQACFNPDSPLTQSTTNIDSNVNTPDSETPIKVPSTGAKHPAGANFGLRQATKIPDFIPDFTLTIKKDEDKLVFMKITRQAFLQALYKDDQAGKRLDYATKIVEHNKELESGNRTRSGTNDPRPVATNGMINPLSNSNTGLNMIVTTNPTTEPNRNTNQSNNILAIQALAGARIRNTNSSSQPELSDNHHIV